MRHDLARKLARLPWRLLVGVVVVAWAVAARARPGGGGSFSSGSGSGGGGGGGGSGGGDDFVIDCVLFLVELCIDYPKIGLPLIGGIIVVAIAVKLLQSDGGKVVLGIAVVGAIAGLLLWRPSLGLGLVGGGGVAVAIAALVGASRRKPDEWHTGAGAPLARPEVATRAPSTSPRRELERLREVDPEFSIVVLEDFLSALYVEAQAARGAGQLARLSPYLAPPVRAALESHGLAEVRDVIVGAMRFAEVRREGARVSLALALECNFTEVTKTGAAHGFYTEERWRLERKADARSRPPARARVFDCPACGAALDAVSGGTCSFCKQAVDTGDHDWLVVEAATLRRDARGPLLTESPPERGTDLPTVVDDDLDARLAELRARDPAFDEAALQARVRLIFDTLQVAWSTQAWLKARPYLSDHLFQAEQYWIDAYRHAHLRNLNEKTAVEKIELVRVTSDKHFDGITVRLYAHGLDYTVDDAGKLVCGSRSTPRRYSEYWTLIRGASVRGAPRAQASCPSCGAPLDVNMAGSCAHCRARVTMGEFDWVLSRIEQDEVYA